jgi:hypothetical protein
LVAKPVESKPKTLRNMLNDDDSEKFEMAVSGKPAKSQRGGTSKKEKRKKMMQMDSDE